MEQELTRLLNTHLQRRPRMQAQDCYKLLYQREFGCGHLAPTLETAVAGLQSEAVQAAELNGTAQLAERAADNTLPGTAEPIGNGLCRIYLDGVWSKEALRLLGRIFCASARTHAGDSARFAAALRLLAHWAQGVLPGTELLALQQIQSTAAANGFFAVHHSQAYRDAYAPHYRVVRQCYADAWPVLLLAQRIREQASAFAPALLAIDGRCGSGKSTLAGHIAEVFACPVFHLDDFFLSPRLRTKERLSQPGENVHHERFLAEVLRPFLSGRTVRFCPFDCSVGAMGDAVEVSPAPFAVAEGSYALHPALRGHYAACIFVICAPEVQRVRIAARSGEDALQVFETKWIPLEEAYFAAYSIPAHANIIWDTSEQGAVPADSPKKFDFKAKSGSDAKPEP